MNEKNIENQFIEKNDIDNIVKDFIVNRRSREDDSEFNEYYKLISDINDLDGVMSEYFSYAIESNNYLQYALVKDNGAYYFFDVRKNSTTLRSKTDGQEFICPYCKQNLFPRSGWITEAGTEVPAHLVHYDKVDKECIFRTFSSEQKKKYKSRIAESYLHFKTKLAFYKLAKLGKLKIKYLSNYKIIEDEVNLSVKATASYKEVEIIDAIMEKKVLSKNEESKGYQPDLIFITKDNDYIFGEVTCKSGKTVRQYEDRWKRVNKVVIDIKPVYGKKDKILNLTGDEITKLSNNTAIIEKDFRLGEIIVPEVELSTLYSPENQEVQEKLHIIRRKYADIRAKREEEEAMRIAELKRQESIEKKKKVVGKDIWHMACTIASKDNIIFDWDIKKWINKKSNMPVNSAYKKIVFDDFKLSRTFPITVWIQLKKSGYVIEG